MTVASPRKCRYRQSLRIGTMPLAGGDAHLPHPIGWQRRHTGQGHGLQGAAEETSHRRDQAHHLFDDRAQAPGQPLAGLAGNATGDGKQSQSPGFEVQEQGIAFDRIQPQHRACNHAEGTPPQL
jgi:hypothetical protein